MCFHVVGILLDRIRQSPDGTQIVIHSSVRNRKHYEHGLAVVRADLQELFDVLDGLVRELLVQVGHGSVEEGVIVSLVGSKTLGEHLDCVLILLLSQEELA